MESRFREKIQSHLDERWPRYKRIDEGSVGLALFALLAAATHNGQAAELMSATAGYFQVYSHLHQIRERIIRNNP